MTAPAVLTVEEAARILRISRSAAYKAAASGEIPAVRVGRTLRVPTHRLMALAGLEGGEDCGNVVPESEDGARGELRHGQPA